MILLYLPLNHFFVSLKINEIIKIIYVYIKVYLFILRGGRGRETGRERENPKQAPHCQHGPQCETQTHKP